MTKQRKKDRTATVNASELDKSLNQQLESKKKKTARMSQKIKSGLEACPSLAYTH